MLSKKGRVLTIFVIVGITVFSGAIVSIHLIINQGINEMCNIAQGAHPHTGDDVGALIQFLEDDNQSFRKRNMTIWTLGQLGDSRALPTLEKYYTGEKCDHNNGLCQIELRKAIKHCNPDLADKSSSISDIWDSVRSVIGNR